jgi:hypothetical protein
VIPINQCSAWRVAKRVKKKGQKRRAPLWFF